MRTTQDEIRKLIFEELEDKVTEFLAGDRKGDPFLPPGSIEHAVWTCTVMISELALEFEMMLRRKIPPYTGRLAIEGPKKKARTRAAK